MHADDTTNPATIGRSVSGWRPLTDGAAGEPVTGRLLVTGSRIWTDEATIRRELTARYRPGIVLVSGACAQGADAMCERIWRELGGRVERHPADWRKYGKAAGFRRNAHMVSLGVDECVAFIQDGSRGGSNCATLAARSGIPVSRHHPSADDYDYRAGLLWRAGQLGQAAAVIARAKHLYPHSPERERWITRETRIRAEQDRRSQQQTLIDPDMEAR